MRESFTKSVGPTNERPVIQSGFCSIRESTKMWIAQAPTPQEAGVLVANQRYVKDLMGRLGDGSGKILAACRLYCLVYARLPNNSPPAKRFHGL
jgi:hypothetical protein